VSGLGALNPINCLWSGVPKLRGWLYSAIFPTLNVMQFDGSYPWGADETVFNCPDAYNLLTIKLTRVK